MVRRIPALVVCWVVLSLLNGFAQTTTNWLGDGASNIWSDTANWANGAPETGITNTITNLRFGSGWLASPTGANRVIATNDLPDFRGHSLNFDPGATLPFFTITGKGFTLLAAGADAPRIALGAKNVGEDTIRLDAGETLRLDGGATGTVEVGGAPTIDRIASIDIQSPTTVLLVGATNLHIPEGKVLIGGSLSGAGGVVVDTKGAWPYVDGATLYDAPKAYIGATVVDRGTLHLLTSISNSAVTVNAAGVLFAFSDPARSTEARMGKMTLNGGEFFAYDYQSDDLTLNGGRYRMRLAIGNRGARIIGTVSLNFTTMLEFEYGSDTRRDGVWTLIDNDGTDAIQGRFLDEAGNVLNEGAVFTSSQNNNQQYRISYAAGTGNDIWIYTVPEPGSAVLLMLGAGRLLAHLRRHHLNHRCL